MEVFDTPLVGLKRIELTLHRDERGFFVERFHAHNFQMEGLPFVFHQENHSHSKPGVLRGLHFQHDPVQAKLVSVVRGRVYDVVVDIRPWSQTYGKYFGIELSVDNAQMLWIPGGFAHGFCVLGDEAADVVYYTSSYYNAAGEGGILYDDRALGIPWPVKDPIVSERDRTLPTWHDYQKSPPMWGEV